MGIPQRRDVDKQHGKSKNAATGCRPASFGNGERNGREEACGEGYELFEVIKIFAYDAVFPTGEQGDEQQ